MSEEEGVSGRDGTAETAKGEDYKTSRADHVFAAQSVRLLPIRANKMNPTGYEMVATDPTEGMTSAGLHKEQFELEQPEKYEPFLLHSKPEILFVLRTLIQKNIMLTAYCENRAIFLLTSITGFEHDHQRFVFDQGSNQAANNAALHAPSLLFATTVEQVKIQFKAEHIAPAQIEEGKASFSAQLPELLLRLQRREFFRLATPMVQPIKCSLPRVRPDGELQVLTTQILDISVGGIGLLIAPAQSEDYAIGTVFEGCHFDLPGEGSLRVVLCVRTVSLAHNQHPTGLRIGCNLVALTSAQEGMIQRYVTRIEQLRKARLKGVS
ncbi:MAG: flagellar regulator YcgR PilZN domain-containing protein [Pseudomonadota bacterium]